ncbi:MAG: post-COAP-1 domain-containing protein [Chloroflexota bacterium]
MTVAVWLIGAIPVAAADSFTPSAVAQTLGAGQSTTIDKTLHLDALPGAADIVIAVDTTGSMGAAIAQAKAQATALCNDVQTAIPDARFAVIDFRDLADYPPDGVVLKTPGFTGDCAVIQAAINTMFAAGGGDTPEAYNEVFHEAYSNTLLNSTRGADALQFLTVLGDAPPHNAPAPTVAPGCGSNTAEALTSDHEIQALVDNDITLLMINYDSGPILTCYQQLAAATGGTAVNAGSDLSATIISQIQTAASHIESVDLVVSTGCPLTVTFAPGSHFGPLTAPTDITFHETITAPGTLGLASCTVTAVVDGANRAVQTLAITVVAGPPASVTLSPPTATNVVDDEHCVTATVDDAFGHPVRDTDVHFGVTGSVVTTGTETTDASGEAEFCYQGPALPGSDVITATVTGVAQPATATKTWILPTTTAGCKITGGGRITAANGDKATFSVNAKSAGLKGQEEFQDHGPATAMNVHSATILAVTCDRTSGRIFGTASINGAGTVTFRIDVKDLGEPGSTDTYRLRLSNGYDTGEQTIVGGNIQLH